MKMFDVLTEVNKFYQGSRVLTDELALSLYELEYGYKPEIDTEDDTHFVNTKVFEKYNAPSHVNKKAMIYMRSLQESGATNMFSSTPYVERSLGLSRADAKEVVLFYMEHYEEIYFPENRI